MVLPLEESLRTGFKTMSVALDNALSTLKFLKEHSIRKRNSSSKGYERYKFFFLRAEPRELISRPVNTDLFIQEETELRSKFKNFEDLLYRLVKKEEVEKSKENRDLVNRVSYTLGISFGIGADFVLDSQSARKNVGERFSDLIISIFNHMKITNAPEVRPYGKSQIDTILSPYSSVRSGREYVDSREVMVSVKTTSKDRFKLIFEDKRDLNSIGEGTKWIAIFLTDVQRQGRNGVAKTFVPGRFLNGYKLTPLSGVYYIDPPKDIKKQDLREKIGTFDELLLDGIWSLL